MTHIMVDLETWGTTPGSDIRSIGAVVFDPVAGTLGDEFYVNLVDGDLWGLTRDPDTEAWWADQSEEARGAFAANPVSTPLGLLRFACWWEEQGAKQPASPVRFWAHGPCFDETLLAAAYRAIGEKVPWHYRAPRDTRTAFEMVGGVSIESTGTAHNALDDARNQARAVIEAHRMLRCGAGVAA